MSKHRVLTVVPKLVRHCSECGCNCSMCNNNSLDLHSEIEELTSRISSHKGHISQLELELAGTRLKTDQETAKLQDELSKLRDRYERLLDSHKKLQRVNNSLEEKLLTVVEKLEKEKTELYESVGMLTSKLSDASAIIEDLEERCSRYQSDCNVAVQLLQCKPSEFVAHKLDTLPLDLGDRVRSYLTKEEVLELEQSKNDSSEVTRAVHIPMSTFPPTAVYSATSSSNQFPSNKHGSDAEAGRQEQTVPMAIIAKALQSNAGPTGQRYRQMHGMCSKCGSRLNPGDGDSQGAAAELPVDFEQSNNCWVEEKQRLNNNSFTRSPGVHKASKCIK